MVVRSIDSLEMRASTHSTMPRGGCSKPLIRLSVIMTPKGTGSMPTRSTLHEISSGPTTGPRRPAVSAQQPPREVIV
jgi:hypothetical protein